MESGPGSIPDLFLEPGGSGVFVAGAQVDGHGIILATVEQWPAEGELLGTEPQVNSIGYGEGRLVTTWVTSTFQVDGFGTLVPGSSLLSVPNATVRGRPATVVDFEGGRSVSWTEPGDFVSVSVSTIDPTVDVVALAESSWSISPDSFRLLRSRTAALAVVARMGGPIDDGSWSLEASVPPPLPVHDVDGPVACADLSFTPAPRPGLNVDTQLPAPREACMPHSGISSLSQVVIAGRGYAFGVAASTADSFRLIADRDPTMSLDLPMEVLRSSSAPDRRWLVVPLPIEAIPCLLVRDSVGNSFPVGDGSSHPLGTCDR